MNVKSSIFRESTETLWPIWASEIDSYESPIVWWEIIKYKIKHLIIERSKSLNITKFKCIKIENRFNVIKNSKNNLLKRVCKTLKQLRVAGESSKVFFNTEKKSASNKIWTKIKCQDGTYSSNINVILNEQNSFYKTLFTSEGSDERESNSLLQN